MMELEKLKDMLYNAAGGPVGIQMCHEAADAIEQLQAENEKLKRALAEMWFAYKNKDGAVPHDFEEQAVELAKEILGPWGECMLKYLRREPHLEREGGHR